MVMTFFKLHHISYKKCAESKVIWNIPGGCYTAEGLWSKWTPALCPLSVPDPAAYFPAPIDEVPEIIFSNRWITECLSVQ